MAHHYYYGFIVLIVFTTVQVLSRPTNDEASVQYLPFYGGAKGQYLEVKKDNGGHVYSEKILSEEVINSENVVKNTDKNLLSRVFAANLQSLKTLSTDLLKTHTIAKKTGYLRDNEKGRFKAQLDAIGEAASETIKLIVEVGDKIDVLFRNNASRRQYEDENVGEEGIAIESPSDTDEILSGTLIAEAKPIGLAVIGENGIAASRPIGTAVAVSGVALAQPIGTAIAGIDPASLGINFNVNNNKN